MSDGYFKIHRQIFDSDIFLNPGLLRLFLYLIGKARYKKEPNKKYKSHNIIIERGQFLRSYRKIQEDLEYLENNAIKKYSLSAIKNNLDKIEEQDRIKREKKGLGTLFTIVNYNKYQNLQVKKEGAANGERTERERSLNNTVRKLKKEVRKLKNKDNGQNSKNLPNHSFLPDNKFKNLPKKYQKIANKINENMFNFAKKFNQAQKKQHPNLITERITIKKNLNGADTIRLLIEQDNKDIGYIKKVLRWGVKDDFWTKQIRSAAALRKKNNSGEKKFNNLAASYEQSEEKHKPQSLEEMGIL